MLNNPKVKYVKISRRHFDLITPKDNNTIYFIEENSGEISLSLGDIKIKDIEQDSRLDDIESYIEEINLGLVEIDDETITRNTNQELEVSSLVLDDIDSRVKEADFIEFKDLTNQTIDSKVDKVTDKGFSTNDYTDAEKDKLSGIEAGAQKNVQSDWKQEVNTANDYIKNKPTIPTKISDLTNDRGYITEYTETDPIFTAWNKSTGISITKSQVSDLIIATQSLSGLMSATDKQRLDALHTLLEEDTENSVVDSINEILDIFQNYPEGADLVTVLAGKVDKVAGKGLSTNDYTTTEKTKLSGIEAGAEVNKVNSVNGQTGVVQLDAEDVGALPDDTPIPAKVSDLDNDEGFVKEIDLETTLLDYVEKEVGKGLSTNDFTDSDKNKLDGIEAGAEKNVGVEFTQVEKTKLATIEQDAEKNTVNSVNGQTGEVVLTKDDVNLPNVDDTADLNKPISTATQTALNLKADKTQLTNYVTTTTFDMQMLEKLAIKPNGSDLLIIGGMINPLYIDDASYKVNHPTVNSQAEMLALDVPPGTVVVRLDTPSKELFLLTKLPASTLANWQVVSSNTVVSVAGKTGVVVLGITDISGLTSALNLKLDITTFESQLTQLQSAIAAKVDKVTGKGLSTEDYTTTEKTKLSGIATNAQKNSDITKAEIEAKLTGNITSHTHSQYLTSFTETDPTVPSHVKSITSTNISSWNGKFDTPTGTTSQYVRGNGSLATFPTIPAAQVQSDWNATTGMGVIKNKPTFATVATSGSYNDLSNKPSIPAAQVAVNWNSTSGITAILNKPNLATVATSGSYNDLSNKPSIPAAQVQSDWNATTGMGVIKNKPALKTVATSGSYNDLSDKPSIPSIPSVMGTTEGNTGTATTQRTINAANLKSIILNHSPAGSRPASDVHDWAKKSSLAIGDIPTGTTGTTVALGNHAHSAATTSAAGFMSAADKTKLNGIATGAQVNRSIATTSQAQAGSNNTTVMTPARVKEAITALGGIDFNYQGSTSLSDYGAYIVMSDTGSIGLTSNNTKSVKKGDIFIYCQHEGYQEDMLVFDGWSDTQRSNPILTGRFSLLVKFN